MINRHRFRTWMIGVVVSTLLLQGGCSNSANRFELTGKVTRDGKPVFFGVIFFEPDATRGGSGPQGSAKIQHGEYRTNDDFGVVEGPHNIRIVSYDGQSPSPFAPYGNSLPEYRTTVNIQKDTPSLDFEIVQAKK